MGIDASLFFYDGDPLAVADWGSPFRAVLEGRLGTTTLAVAHLAHAGGEACTRPVHAMALFEPADHALRIERDDVEKAASDAAEQSQSLASIVRAAFRLARGGLVETSANFRAADPPDEWPAGVVVELSRVRPGALWAAACDHSLVGGYAHAEGGRLVASAMVIDGDGYAREPDRALARFTGDAGASVRAGLRGPLDAPLEGLSFALLAERGEFLASPPLVAPDTLREFQHVLLDFGTSLRLRLDGPGP